MLKKNGKGREETRFQREYGWERENLWKRDPGGGKVVEWRVGLKEKGSECLMGMCQ